MREKPKDQARLLHMLESIDNIFEFVNGIGFDNIAGVQPSSGL
jgi:uncharacterized protein with HEPN domain